MQGATRHVGFVLSGSELRGSELPDTQALTPRATACSKASHFGATLSQASEAHDISRTFLPDDRSGAELAMRTDASNGNANTQMCGIALVTEAPGSGAEWAD